VQRGGHIIVGTPGRVMDMHGRRQITFDNLRFAVLDEVDRMLDIGFRDDIRKILSSIKRPHQTIFVSATIDEAIERLGRTFMQPDAQKIMTVSGSLTVSLVDQKFLTVEAWDKKQLLLHLLKKEQPQTTVVFCRTKATVDKLSHYLRDKGVDVRHLHGDMPQVKRTKVMDKMRSGSLSVLIASDLAARGLDVEHITHVINYDLPEDPDIYVHRIGRTARTGRDGIAWAFVTPDQGELLTAIEMLTNVEIPRAEYPDFKPGPKPVEVVQREQRAAERETEIRAKYSRDLKPPPAEAVVNEQKFPGGIVPVAVPAKRLRGKVPRRR
jgi:ATP-dependent RNA helicase DeaD